MADINLKQVIHNVKEAYVGLTGDTDAITYGNISTKISEIETGGGSADGSLSNPFVLRANYNVSTEVTI